MQDALERAYGMDVQGAPPEECTKVYKIALQAIEEGLQVPVQGSGG
jgi:hypothetical protein